MNERLKLLLTPRAYLKIGGLLFVIFAVFGAVGFLGPSGDRSIFAHWWFFDVRENWMRLVLGLIMIASTHILRTHLQRLLTTIIALWLLFLALMAFSSDMPDGVMVLGASFQHPADTLLHLLFALWGLYAAFPIDFRRFARRT